MEKETKMEKKYCCGRLLVETDHVEICSENSCVPIRGEYAPVRCRKCKKVTRVYKREMALEK